MRYIVERLAYNRRHAPQLNSVIFEDGEIRESADTEDVIATCMSNLYNRYGSLNGGDCGTVAYYVSDMLDSVVDYSFSGELVDGVLSHVMIKCNGNYYDATNSSGYADTAGCHIVDNLECVEQNVNAIPAIIGNDEYGWIDCFRPQREFISIIKNSFYDSMRESTASLKTLKGSVIKRSSKYGVGKDLSNHIQKDTY